MQEVDYIKPGTRIEFIDGEVFGRIHSVVIEIFPGQPPQLTYNCNWWDGGELKTGNFALDELKVIKESALRTIGFTTVKFEDQSKPRI